MKTKLIAYLLWILLLSNLFYSEFFGLNILISTVVSIGLTTGFHPKLLKQPKWWMAVLIWLISAIAVFLHGTILHGFMFFAGFLFFYAVSNNHKLSMIFGPMQSIQSLFTGMFYYFDSITKSFSREKEKKNRKGLVNFVIGAASFLVLFVFLKLYQSADPTFAKWTEFLNLEWISWGFIAFYIVLSLLLYGIFFYRRDPGLDQWEDSLKSEIPISYTDRLQKFFGTKTEFKAALGLLIPLNLMLLLYNFIDLRYIFTKLYSTDKGLTYSEMVHDGVNALIFSIVLVILLLTFLFRGSLNFSTNKSTKFLALFWLVQNLLMVGTTSIKNFEYISHWGLTYKRIGVYIWLGLAVIGLVLTIVKILKTHSFWFLLRSGSIAFALAFSLLLLPSWNRLIADFNLNNVAKERIDFEYLVSIGPETHPAVIQYHNEVAPVDLHIMYQMTDEISKYIYRFEQRKEKTSWRSHVFYREKLYDELKKIEFNFRTPQAQNSRKSSRPEKR